MPTTSYNFSNVDVALLGFGQGTRQSVRDVLLSNGIRRLHDASNIDQMRRLIVGVEPDLLLFQVDRDPDAAYQLVTDIRHGRLGSNPYVVVFGFTWRAEKGLVTTSINAGVDDIITMPISIQTVFDRIDNIIRQRKNFVVTSEYIGPDRRNDERPISGDDSSFPVPNVLKLKAETDGSAEVDLHAIARANRVVVARRLRRLTTRLNSLASGYEQKARDMGPHAVPPGALEDMQNLIRRIGTQLEAEGHHHLLELANSMHDAIVRVRQTSEPTVKVFELLKLHSQAVSASLQASSDASEKVLSALHMAHEYSGGKEDGAESAG